VTGEALVIGGGPAGSALALHLARAGRQVTLVERSSGPHHKVCGEFLSGEAVAELEALGLSPDSLGAADIRTVSLACGRTVAEAALPFRASSLSRLRLDEALLELAAAHGVEVKRGRRATRLVGDGPGWRAEGPGWTETAEVAALCVGKHDLRDWKRPSGGQDDLVGFKQHWRLGPQQTRALEGRVELFLFPGGYAGLEPVEGGVANLCAVIRQGDLSGGWAGALSRMQRTNPRLSERLEGGAPCWPRPLAVAALPYGHVARTSAGIWRLGDQAAVIPPFAGDGLAIALHSARLAAGMMLAGADADAFQHRLARDLGAQVRWATRLSRLLARPGLQPLIAWAASRSPALLVRTARATRIRAGALIVGQPSRGHDRSLSTEPVSLSREIVDDDVEGRVRCARDRQPGDGGLRVEARAARLGPPAGHAG
jgi:flavin-dependent dehydrogenase